MSSFVDEGAMSQHTSIRIPGWHGSHDPLRERLRRAAVGLSVLVAVLYGLIATSVVTVIEGTADEVATSQLAFATPAVVAYLLGAVLLARHDRRLVHVLGAMLQVLVIAAYLDVASDRVPAFEVWGVTIRVVQVLLLAVLVALALRLVEAAERSDE